MFTLRAWGRGRAEEKTLGQTLQLWTQRAWPRGHGAAQSSYTSHWWLAAWGWAEACSRQVGERCWQAETQRQQQLHDPQLSETLQTALTNGIGGWRSALCPEHLVDGSTQKQPGRDHSGTALSVFTLRYRWGIQMSGKQRGAWKCCF